MRNENAEWLRNKGAFTAWPKRWTCFEALMWCNPFVICYGYPSCKGKKKGKQHDGIEQNSCSFCIKAEIFVHKNN